MIVFNKVPKFLSECFRVLKPGTCLRIIVPDGSKIVIAYCDNKWQEVGLDPLNWITPMHAVNHIFHQDGEHKFCYDFETIELLLKKAGFREVFKQNYGDSVDPDLVNDQSNHRSHSLYVDCIK